MYYGLRAGYTRNLTFSQSGWLRL